MFRGKSAKDRSSSRIPLKRDKARSKIGRTDFHQTRSFKKNPDSDLLLDSNFQRAEDKKILQRRIRFNPTLVDIFTYQNVL
jgi:hypothetical protein